MKKQTKTNKKEVFHSVCGRAHKIESHACPYYDAISESRFVIDADRRVFLKANGWQPSYKSILDVIHDEMGIYPIKFLLRRIYPSAWVDYKTKHNLREE